VIALPTVGVMVTDTLSLLDMLAPDDQVHCTAYVLLPLMLCASGAFVKLQL
jgi:hypothetical protein